MYRIMFLFVMLTDLVNWNVTMSNNVFLERIQAISWVDTPLYVTNNKQALQFIWRSPNSGEYDCP